jgi:hypothetical protein
MGSASIPGTVRELSPSRCYLGNKGDEYLPGRPRRELTKGTGICKTVKLTSTGTMHKLRREMGAV